MCYHKNHSARNPLSPVGHQCCSWTNSPKATKRCLPLQCWHGPSEPAWDQWMQLPLSQDRFFTKISWFSHHQALRGLRRIHCQRPGRHAQKAGPTQQKLEYLQQWLWIRVWQSVSHSDDPKSLSERRPQSFSRCSRRPPQELYPQEEQCKHASQMLSSDKYSQAEHLPWTNSRTSSRWWRHRVRVNYVCIPIPLFLKWLFWLWNSD